MVINSTNINKTNNHLSPQLNTKRQTCDVGNPGIAQFVKKQYIVKIKKLFKLVFNEEFFSYKDMKKQIYTSKKKYMFESVRER